MRTGISSTLKPADRRHLKALMRDRDTPQKHVWRAEIVLLSVNGVGTNEIMRRTDKSKTCVWRWQERFMREVRSGLLRDKTRPSHIPRLGPDVAERVVALTQAAPPVEATHWTSAMMAKAVGISPSSIQRIWHLHGLQPHRIKQFKLSTDRTHPVKAASAGCGLGGESQLCPDRPSPWSTGLADRADWISFCMEVSDVLSS